jgi:monofunctional biosynthetic peptidoglycan transglycosylase
MRVEWNLRGLLRKSLAVAVALLVFFLALVTVYAYVPPVSTVMVWRWITGDRVIRHWRPLELISPNLVHAVIVSEDSRICLHRGVDWTEVRKVVAEADDLGSARGASTIAMQTARNLFLWQGRSYVRKAIEVPIAHYLSLAWPQRRLVEVYLNVVQWGPDGEFGAEAAARRAFRKSVRRLAVHEAALLASALPNPLVRNPGRPGPVLRRVTARNLAAMSLDGGYSTECLDIGE